MTSRGCLKIPTLFPILCFLTLPDDMANIDQIPDTVAKARKAFESRVTRDLAWRKEQLRQFYYLVDDNKQRWIDALHKDMRKSETEALGGEITISLNETVVQIENMDKWAGTEYPSVEPAFALNRCRIRKEPLGVILIISPWNYPLVLSAAPFAGAIAAGNCVVLKPSEIAPHTAALWEELVPKYLDPNCFKVINGAVPETTKLLELKFDHICYTGNGTVAKIVAAAAAKQLTPITLELGGQSPAIVCEDADIPMAAKRIAWSKMYSAGQTCIATNHVLVCSAIKDKFVKAFAEEVKKTYPEGAQKADRYTRIVNANHWNRIMRLVKASKGEVIAGGGADESDLYIEPTFVEVSEGDALLSEELFAPVCPILEVENVDAAVAWVNARDHPLAIYVYSRSKKTREYVIEHTTSGACVENDAMMQYFTSFLPFGGVGPSGMGAYRGKYSFETFSHKRSIMFTPGFAEPLISGRYLNSSKNALNLMMLLVSKRPSFNRKPGSASGGGVSVASALVVAVAAVAMYLYRGDLKAMFS